MQFNKVIGLIALIAIASVNALSATGKRQASQDDELEKRQFPAVYQPREE
jgi:hypothetical protein